MTVVETGKKSYKLVPPDGGYGYVILGATSLNLIATTMFGTCFGMIFNDFFVHLGMGSTEISLLTGINAMCVSISGFLTGPLLKIMSRRMLALVGSIFFNCGCFGTVFIKTKAQFILCQGLLQCFGIGFLFNVSCTMLNDYFARKLLFSMSLSQTLAAGATMIAPMVVSWSKEVYGIRGTLIIMSAIGIQTFVATALLQPVAWHMKKEVQEVSSSTEKRLLLQIDKPKEKLDLNNKVLQTPVVKLTDVETADDLFYEEKKSKKQSIWSVVITWIKNFLDWPLFKKFVLTCGCLGAPIALFADVTFLFFLAQALYHLKWDDDQVKWAFALVGFGDIAARIVLIFSSSFLNKLGSHFIYVLGLLIAIATKLVMLWTSDYTATLIIITIMGISRCTITVLYPLVVADSVQPEQFPSAMGISMMMFGIISIVVGPAVGAVRDATGNYSIMFLVLIGFMVGITVAWVIELWRNRGKKITLQTEK